MFPSKLFFDDVLNNLEEKNKMNCDVYEKDDKFYIEIDMPGIKKEDITINLNKGNLNITVEKENTEEDSNRKYLCRERKIYRKYQRSFYLGDVMEENIEASFNNGILNIVIPKKQEENSNRIIEIK